MQKWDFKSIGIGLVILALSPDIVLKGKIVVSHIPSRYVRIKYRIYKTKLTIERDDD